MTSPVVAVSGAPVSQLDTVSLLCALLSTDNNVRSQAEVSKNKKEKQVVLFHEETSRIGQEIEQLQFR